MRKIRQARPLTSSLGVSILIVLPYMVMLHQPGYAGNEHTHAITASQEVTPPSPETTPLLQEEMKSSQPLPSAKAQEPDGTYATLKKFLSIGAKVVGGILFLLICICIF